MTSYPFYKECIETYPCQDVWYSSSKVEVPYSEVEAYYKNRGKPVPSNLRPCGDENSTLDDKPRRQVCLDLRKALGEKLEE